MTRFDSLGDQQMESEGLSLSGLDAGLSSSTTADSPRASQVFADNQTEPATELEMIRALQETCPKRAARRGANAESAQV